MVNLRESIVGCILGTAVGDALGLCSEGLTRRRQQKIFGRIENYRFFQGKGMCSDDTEHTLMVAQSLIRSGYNHKAFLNDFAWRLRWWLLRLPAGVGWATLRACVKLWMGVSPSNSGVFSAGNGPCMRAPILGVCLGDNFERLKSFLNASTKITHTDSRAVHGAMAIALAAHLAKNGTVTPADYLQKFREWIPYETAEDLHRLIERVVTSVREGRDIRELLRFMSSPSKVSGYVLHTVPIVIHVWLTHQDDYYNGVLDIIRMGGDTDTTAAILGGIIGANVGKKGIPQHWLANLIEWPATVEWMERLGEQLSDTIEKGQPQEPLRVSSLLLFCRNLFFTILVLGHGVKRLVYLLKN